MVLCEGCLKSKFQPDRFLNFRLLYVGFTVLHIFTSLLPPPLFNGHLLTTVADGLV